MDATGYVYVADSVNHRIQTFDRGGNCLTTRGVLGSGPGEFQVPAGVAADAAFPERPSSSIYFLVAQDFHAAQL